MKGPDFQWVLEHCLQRVIRLPSIKEIYSIQQWKFFNPLTTNVLDDIEISQLICSANQLTGFYMIGNIGLKVKMKIFPEIINKMSHISNL